MKDVRSYPPIYPPIPWDKEVDAPSRKDRVGFPSQDAPAWCCAGVGPNCVVALPAPPQLFPRRTLVHFPPPVATADSLGEVEASDHVRYVVKGDPPGRLLCASEWICTHLAEAVGLVGPSTAIIEMPSSELVFGSRKLPGIASQAATINYLLQNPIQPAPVLPAAPSVATHLSEIYAFDLAIQNEDRHLNNYLMAEDAGIPRLYAFDYSRSLFWSWPLNGFPAAQTKTRFVGAMQIHAFDLQAATALVRRLAALNDATLQILINQMPSAWLPAAAWAQLETWWSNGSRAQRFQALEQGLANGTLL
jgi:hypothetical protein